jgi:hypothetical protein
VHSELSRSPVRCNARGGQRSIARTLWCLDQRQRRKRTSAYASDPPRISLRRSLAISPRSQDPSRFCSVAAHAAANPQSVRITRRFGCEQPVTPTHSFWSLIAQPECRKKSRKISTKKIQKKLPKKPGSVTVCSHSTLRNSGTSGKHRHLVRRGGRRPVRSAGVTGNAGAAPGGRAHTVTLGR